MAHVQFVKLLNVSTIYEASKTMHQDLTITVKEINASQALFKMNLSYTS